MAFQQPQQRPQSSRQVPTHPPPDAQLDVSASWQLETQKTIEESQEWVLFSPQPPSVVTARTQTTSTDRTPRTAGLSRLSDFGSLDTAAARSALTPTADGEDDDVVTHHGTEDDDELNSLDDGLHAFHEPSDYSAAGQRRLDQSGGTVLPTHDGLGTFQASSDNVQAQLWQFEKYNPRRASRHRRRSSLAPHLDRLDEGQEWVEDNEKTRRIEKWRIEQSIALLEEIERETRRMRRIGKAGAGSRSRASSAGTHVSQAQRRSSMPGAFTSDEEEQQPEEQESFWSRFTKRILRDLMGLDENILSVILGEELPEEARMVDDGDAIDVEAALQDEPDVDLSTEPWQHRVLERIARELGVLVNHLTEHPGAFSTYLRTQELPEYAGLPNTTTTTSANVPDEATAGTPTTPGAISSTSNHQNPYFPPTVQSPIARATSYSEASLWGIEEEDENDRAPIPGITDEAERLRREKEHWERELDVKMVFNFLKQRFGSRAPPSPSADFLPRPRPYPIDAEEASPYNYAYTYSSHAQPSSHRRTGSSTPITSARRQAMIRQHHPLVGSEAARALQKRRERERESAAAALRAQQQQHYGIPPHMRSGSGSFRTSPKSASIASHASQTSAKSSKRKRSHSGSSKSRNFWDVGGSQVGSASGIGAWGEV